MLKRYVGGFLDWDGTGLNRTGLGLRTSARSRTGADSGSTRCCAVLDCLSRIRILPSR